MVTWSVIRENPENKHELSQDWGGLMLFGVRSFGSHAVMLGSYFWLSAWLPVVVVVVVEDHIVPG